MAHLQPSPPLSAAAAGRPSLTRSCGLIGRFARVYAAHTRPLQLAASPLATAADTQSQPQPQQPQNSSRSDVITFTDCTPEQTQRSREVVQAVLGSKLE